jgi:hypothetical protein
MFLLGRVEPGSDVVIRKITRKRTLSIKSNLCHLGLEPFASGFFGTEAVMTDEIVQSFHSPVNKTRGTIMFLLNSRCCGSGSKKNVLNFRYLSYLMTKSSFYYNKEVPYRTNILTVCRNPSNF